MMYCPKCATPASPDQKFCRACGWSLQPHAQALAGQSPPIEPAQTSPERSERLQKRQRRVLFWGVVTLVGGTIQALVAGHVYYLMGEASGVVDPAMSTLLSGVTGVGMLILLIGLCLMGYWGFLKASNMILLPKPTALPQAALTTKLPPERQPEPMPSVTEHTTERLEASEAPIPARDTARQRE